ncbi:MAG: hypothetical protein ACP59X_17475 [Solidesulfovibrio sp. DCME]|uniref:hypothetical protein n=1 Tax=Solidesulfovibrio sp. DCME TaxID=3447380 RepID=UPI003D152BF1
MASCFQTKPGHGWNGLFLLCACALGCLLWSALPARAQALPPEFLPDLAFEQIAANRAAYDRVVFIFGDSVAMMCSLEQVDFSKLRAKKDDTQYMVSAMAEKMRQANVPGDKVNDPLWCMHSLGTAMNSLFAASGLQTAVNHGLTIPSAKLVAAYAGGLGLPFPKDVTARVNEIAKLFDTGVIRDGDVVIMEDAGYNGQNPDAYEANWLALGRAALHGAAVTLILFDMFDDIPEEPVMGIPPDGFRFEAAFPSPTTGGRRSHNQALRDAAAQLAADKDNKGTLVFLDMRRRMDAFRAALADAFGVSALTPEGIHPNVWGEAFLARELLRTAGLAPLLGNPQPYRDVLVANASRLALGDTAVDPDKARDFINTWLIP